jgi:hypothetical protein
MPRKSRSMSLSYEGQVHVYVQRETRPCIIIDTALNYMDVV